MILLIKGKVLVGWKLSNGRGVTTYSIGLPIHPLYRTAQISYHVLWLSVFPHFFLLWCVVFVPTFCIRSSFYTYSKAIHHSHSLHPLDWIVFNFHYDWTRQVCTPNDERWLPGCLYKEFCISPVTHLRKMNSINWQNVAKRWISSI